MYDTTTPPGVESHGPAIVVTAIVGPIVAACFVGLRIYTRRVVTRSFGPDDWCSIATLGISVVYSVLLSIATYHGMGMHQKEMKAVPGLEAAYYKWLLISSEFYVSGLLGYKTAILLLYVRLFGVNKKFRITCYVTMAFNAAYLTSNLILQVFSCTPVEKFFDPKIPGHCVSLIPPDIAWGCMNMLSDLAIAILPIPMIWKLKLPRRGKILLSLVFLSGLLAFAVAIARWLVSTIDLTVASDRTYLAGLGFLLSIWEVNTGIICGCTATFRPLFRFAKDQAHIYRSRRKSAESRRSAESIRRQQTPPPSDGKKHFWQPSAGSHPSVATTVVGSSNPSKKDSKSSTSSPLSSATRATAPPQRAPTPTPELSPVTLAGTHGPEMRKVSTEHSGHPVLGPEVSKVPTDRSGSDKIALPRASSASLQPSLPAANPPPAAAPPASAQRAPSARPQPPHAPPPSAQPPPAVPASAATQHLAAPAPNVDKSLPPSPLPLAPSPLAVEEQQYPFRLPATEPASAARPEDEAVLDPMLARFRADLRRHEVDLPSRGPAKALGTEGRGEEWA